MNLLERIIISCLLAALAVAPSPAAADERGVRRASLVTVEGVVTAVETTPGEGGVQCTVVRLALDDADGAELPVALAPGDALHQIGFEVRVGDRLRAKIFVDDDLPRLAHKVANVTRATMVRLRTLSRIPLWDGSGRWQGGPSRVHHGGRGRHGPGGRR